MDKSWRQPAFKHPSGGLTAIKGLSDSDIGELLAPLGLPETAENRARLSAAIRTAASQLIGAFDPGDADPEAERRDEIVALAANAARALERAPASRTAGITRATVLAAAGVDQETRKGVLKIENMAGGQLVKKRGRIELSNKGRKGANFVQGERDVLGVIVRTLYAISPASIDGLPSNDARGKSHPAIDFAGEFVVKVADRALLAISPENTEAHERLIAFKGRGGTLLDGLRKARAAYRAVEKAPGDRA